MLTAAEDRIDRIEMPLARLLHLLAHHPDLDWASATEVKDLTRFIELFVELVANGDNASLLFTIANKLKTVRDASEELDHAQIQRIIERGTSRLQVKAEDDGDAAMSDAEDASGSSPTLVSRSFPSIVLTAEPVQARRARADHHQGARTPRRVEHHDVGRRGQAPARHLPQPP